MAAASGCFDVCPTHCGVCQAPLRGGHLRLLAEHLRNASRAEGQVDEGRLAYELGLAPCCAALALGRREEQESLRRYLEWSGHGVPEAPPLDGLREVTEALPDGLLYAGVLRDLGRSLDRAYLDGLHGEESLAGVRAGAARANLTAELLAPTTSARRLASGSTVVRVECRVSCALSFPGQSSSTRVLRAWCDVPAPLGGYISTADKKRGNVMHVALRTELVPHEVEARAESTTRTSARMLDGSGAVLRLVLSWRGAKELVGAALSLPAPARQDYEQQACERKVSGSEVPLETLLRALFGISSGAVEARDAAEIKRLFFDACRGRTGCVVDGDDVLRKDRSLAEYLFDDRVMNGSSGFAADEAQLDAARAQLRRLGVAALPLRAEERTQLFAETAALVSGGAPASGKEAAAAAVALDKIARLYLHALRVHLDPQGEPAEQARAVTWPGAAARAGAAAALRALLYGAAKSLVERKPGDTSLPARLGLVGQGLPPSAAARAVVLEWQQGAPECPACGEVPAPGAVCLRCEAESKAELARTPVRGGTARGAPPLRLRCSAAEAERACWWSAGAEAAAGRFAFRLRQWSLVRLAAARELRLEGARWCAAPREHRQRALRRALARAGYFPRASRRVLHRRCEKRGAPSSAARVALTREARVRLGIACTAAARLLLEVVAAGLSGAMHAELRGSGARRPPCLAVADPEEGGPHAASVVATGIVASQVDSAHGRRRPNAELEGVRDGAYNHEKTTEQRRVLCVGVHWSPPLDEEDLRCVCECAALALRDLRASARRGTEAAAVADFARLRLGQGSPLARATALRAQRASFLRCPGDQDLAAAEQERLSLLEALEFNRALTRRLRERLLDWRLGEEAAELGSGERVRVRGALLELHGAPPCCANRYVVGRRLPRRDDEVLTDDGWRRVRSVLSLRLEDGTLVEPTQLRKLPPRGDEGKLPPLAYVNAVLNERESSVDVRVQGGFVCLPVQLARVPSAPRRDAWTHLLEDVVQGRVGLWHASALAVEEEVNAEAELPQAEDGRMRFRYLLGEAGMRGARACLMPSALGHMVRLAAQLRSLGQCARAPPAAAVAPWGALAGGPSVDGGLAVSPGALSPPGVAPGVLMHVALVDDLAGKTWEDAAVADVDFLAALGRCLHSVTSHTPRCAGRILTRAEVAALEHPDEEALRRLDADGRAHGPVRQGDALAFAQDGTPLRCPFDAIADHWGWTARGAPCVLLVVQESWGSGAKVVWSLQKSVVSSVESMIVAPQAISYVRSEPSCVSRNAPSTWLCAQMLELCHARGFAAHRTSCKRRLPAHAEVLDGTVAASAAKVRAARQLCPGINSSGRYPVVDRLSGRPAGMAFIGPQYQGFSLKNSAAQKLSMHLGPGSKARRGELESRGQKGERMEQALTHCGGAFGPNRPAGADRAVAPPAMVEARARILARFGAALAMRPEEEDA